MGRPFTDIDREAMGFLKEPCFLRLTLAGAPAEERLLWTDL